jgi:hypothetical protein
MITIRKRLSLGAGMDFDERGAADASAYEYEWDPVYGENGSFDESRGVMEQSPKFPCGRCPRAPRLLTRRFEAFFRGEHLPCPTCGQPIDIWSQLRNIAWLRLVGDVVGTRVTSVDVRDLPVGPTTIELSDYGVPVTATVFSISYSSKPSHAAMQAWFEKHEIAKRYPRGGSIDEEFGDEPWRDFDPTVLLATATRSSEVSAGDQLPLSLSFLHQAPSRSGVATDLDLRVAWFDTERAADEWTTLFNAFLLALRGQRGPAVVLANAAVESRLYELLNGVLADVVGRGTTEDFLKDVGYGHQLRALLPIVARLSGWPNLPEDIAGQLNRLRRRRNDFAHLDASAEPLTDAEVSSLMVAGSFGLHYLGFVRRALTGEDSHSP